MAVAYLIPTLVVFNIFEESSALVFQKINIKCVMYKYFVFQVKTCIENKKLHIDDLN